MSSNAPQFVLSVPKRNNTQCHACRLPILAKTSIRLASKSSKASSSASWEYDHLGCLRTGTIGKCLSTYGLTTSATDLSPIPGFDTLSSAQQNEVREHFSGILTGTKTVTSLSSLEVTSNEAARRQELEARKAARAAVEAIRSKKKARRAIPLAEYDWRSELESGDLNAEETAKFLRNLCKHLDLKQAGSNATLIARLKKHAKKLDGNEKKKPATDTTTKKRKMMMEDINASSSSDDEDDDDDDDDNDDDEEEIINGAHFDDCDDGCQGFKDCRVAKIFGGKIYLGAITGSDDDAENKGEKLYRVEYEDGDEEDYTVTELYAAIELYEQEYLQIEDTRVRVIDEDSDDDDDEEEDGDEGYEEEENIGTLLEQNADDPFMGDGKPKENPPSPHFSALANATSTRTKAVVGKSRTFEPPSILRDQLHQTISPATARKVRTSSSKIC